MSNFKANELEKIVNATVSEVGEEKPPSPYYVTKGASLITNENEMEVYLLKLRREMLQLLKNNKTIIIK